jgi:hypothetical protein
MKPDLDLTRAIFLGRMLGVTAGCADYLEPCDRDMLVARLQRIAECSREINQKIIELESLVLSSEFLSEPWMVERYQEGSK